MEDLLRPLKRMRIHESEISEFKTYEISKPETKEIYNSEILTVAKKGKRRNIQMDNYISDIIIPFKKIRIIKTKKSNKRRYFQNQSESLSKRNCGNSENEIYLKISEISDIILIDTVTHGKSRNIIEYPKPQVEISTSPISSNLDTKTNKAVVLIQRIVRGWIHRNRFRFIIYKFYI